MDQGDTENGLKIVVMAKTIYGAHLAQLRKAAGFTQVELAEAVGLSQQTVAKWEANDRPPPSKMLPNLAKLFGVTVEEILNIKAGSSPRKRGPPSRGHKLLDDVERLPPRQKEKIYDVLSALVDQYSRAS
jgi:transcriptional regulator with XRE-family HTH domain